jgi:capsular exopolysaccharide synthesis family protein
VALVASLGLGITISLVLGFLDDTLRNVEEVEAASNLPILAAIPSGTNDKQRRRLPFARRPIENGNNKALVINGQRTEPHIEAYLHLRTSILLSSAGGPPKRLLITASQPSEGKTTTAINIATVLAQTGAKVLLIDGDLRRPSVHHVLGLDNKQGLTNLVAKDRVSEADIYNIIEKHEKSGVYVLTAGSSAPNPANLLASEQLRGLMKAFDAEFNYIIIDSPPIVFFTDGAIWSSLAEGVLFVVRSRQSSRASVQHGLRILHDVNARIFGVVLNDVSISSSPYYSQYEAYSRSSPPEDLINGGPALELGIKQ